MQRLNTLTGLVNAASTVAEFARAAQLYRFNDSATVYLHIAGAEVRVVRRPAAEWDHIEVMATLQAPFAWRIASDQDEAGVYFVARRRPVVGAVAGASFTLTTPAHTYVVLRLEDARLSIDGVTGTVELPPGGGFSIIPTS